MAIYYFCTEPDGAAGGVQVIYRHVDLLNSNGIESYVLHSRQGYRASWFANKTPIAYLQPKPLSRFLNKEDQLIYREKKARIRIAGSKTKVITPQDILVLPEILGPGVAAIGPGIPKAILNQNCYYTFRHYPLTTRPLTTPYNNPDVVATLINSYDGEDYIRYAFPEISLERFQLSIDKSLFFSSQHKKDVICYFPRKNLEDARQVINILKIRGHTFKHYELRALNNQTQHEVASNLREAKIFLSFGHPEGFGLLDAETMACGCAVVGYHGGGGKEFFDPEFTRPIQVGDIVGFSQAVEELVCLSLNDPVRFRSLGEKAAKHITEVYSPEAEEAVIVSIWRRILSRMADLE